MEIKGVTITQNELNEAVQSWLERNGVKVQVTNVDKKYSYSSVYDVDFRLTVDPQAELPRTIPPVRPTETELAVPATNGQEVQS